MHFRHNEKPFEIHSLAHPDSEELSDRRMSPDTSDDEFAELTDDEVELVDDEEDLDELSEERTEKSPQGSALAPYYGEPNFPHQPFDRPSYRSQYADDEAARPVMKMTQAAYSLVMSDLSSDRFYEEEGGILFGPSDTQDLVTHYVKDRHGRSSAASFTVDHKTLNKSIKHRKPASLSCIGIIHSHPHGITRPSGGDIAYLSQLFSDTRNQSGQPYFLFPIVCGRTLYPYVVDTRNPRRILFAELVLI